jgi:hypothetical protein
MKAPEMKAPDLRLLACGGLDNYLKLRCRFARSSAQNGNSPAFSAMYWRSLNLLWECTYHRVQVNRFEGIELPQVGDNAAWWGRYYNVEMIDGSNADNQLWSLTRNQQGVLVILHVSEGLVRKVFVPTTNETDKAWEEAQKCLDSEAIIRAPVGGGEEN